MKLLKKEDRTYTIELDIGELYALKQIVRYMDSEYEFIDAEQLMLSESEVAEIAESIFSLTDD